MKWFKRLLLTVVAFAILGGIGLYFALRSSLPQMDGAVVIAGASAPIEISREANGSPHIQAANEADAYFGLGFAHAQDRLWQMEMNRRIAAGRTAEILGEKAVDVWLRKKSMPKHNRCITSSQIHSFIIHASSLLYIYSFKRIGKN